MYKISVTEEEARSIGAERWRVQHRGRYMWLILGLLFGTLLAVPLTSLLLPSWVAPAILIAMLIVAAAFALRFNLLSAKAGREFAQSLKRR